MIITRIEKMIINEASLGLPPIFLASKLCSGLIALAFGTVLLRWFARGGIHGGRRFTLLVWLALAGCLVHARYDFPFQVHSIVFLFLVICAIQFNLTRRA